MKGASARLLHMIPYFKGLLIRIPKISLSKLRQDLLLHQLIQK